MCGSSASNAYGRLGSWCAMGQRLLASGPEGSGQRPAGPPHAHDGPAAAPAKARSYTDAHVPTCRSRVQHRLGRVRRPLSSPAAHTSVGAATVRAATVQAGSVRAGTLRSAGVLAGAVRTIVRTASVHDDLLTAAVHGLTATVLATVGEGSDAVRFRSFASGRAS